MDVIREIEQLKATLSAFITGDIYTAKGTYTVAVTGSVGNPTITNTNGWYRQLGKALHLIMVCGPVTAVGSGYYLFSIPAGMTIDTTIDQVSTISATDGAAMTLFAPVGIASIGNQAGSWQWPLKAIAVVLDSTHIGLVLNSTTADRAFGVGSNSAWNTVGATFNVDANLITT